MFPPSSPLLSLTSSIESDQPNYSTSDPNLNSTSSFIRHHSLYFLDLTEMDSTNTIPQSLSQSNSSSSNDQPSIDLSDPMLSTISSDQPSMDFYPGQIPISTSSDYGLQSFTPTTSTDLSTNFLLEDNPFRSTDGINLSPHLTGLQLGIFNPTFDRLIQSSPGSGLNHSEQVYLQPPPNQNQHHHQQILSFQPLIHSSVSSDSIPRATQNPLLDYPSGLGVSYPLDLQSTPLPNLGGFLSCFESPPTSFLTQAPEPEVGIPAEEGVGDAQLQVNSARCTDWHSFVSSSPSSTDERSQSPGELGQGSNLFLFSIPTVRGNTGEAEDIHTGVRMIDLEGVRSTEDLFGEGLSKRSWWNQPISSVLPTNTITDDHDDSSHNRICSTTTTPTTTTTTTTTAGVARRVFGPHSISRKSKRSNTTLNKRNGNILIGSSSEQILDYNLMPTKRSRGRRPPVSPEVGLPMNVDGDLNFDLEIGLQSLNFVN
ncbi:hypothetical protein CROQUDRAFT_713401 [Cronartium quercuum f. sp. fusiforme G11]|uniref:Uncharacterized protein n=1 Tax=Cronartium quercuum f. sp. fusiforme G11 TaxID=708437 RepID=A0A9P6NNL4_9BASI|nr:hypothetical protein CROQUDRAFT_713401 [Cronartium quercuum f. sp. fusiforme G11]